MTLRWWPERRPSGAAAPAPWTVELQFLPARGGRLRRLVLSRRRLTVWSIGILLLTFFIALALLVAPGVVTGWFEGQVYGGLAGVRAKEGERLKTQVRRLTDLEARAEGIDLALQKIELAYGLPGGAAVPAPEPEAPIEPIEGSIYAGVLDQGDRLRLRIEGRLRRIAGMLGAVERHEKAAVGATEIPSLCPLAGTDFVALALYGNRRSPFTRRLAFHAGLDLAAPRGTPIHAPAAGEVIFAGAYSTRQSAAWWRRGNLVVLRHGDGFLTFFAHCAELKVEAGQKVGRGQVIATVGSSGLSSGPHLYYEIRRRLADGVWRPVDPLLYVFDHPWPNEARLIEKAKNSRPPTLFEPLPPGLGE